MKKLFIILFMLSQILAGAWEIQIKTGYDFYRKNNKNDKKYDAGFVIGLEYLHANRGIIELGTGVEYMYIKQSDASQNNKNNNKEYILPIYLLGKLNYYTTFDNTKSFYGFTRLGYAISYKESNSINHNFYYGVGIGFEFEIIVFEGIYDAKYSKSEFLHKLGLRTGIRIGNYKKKLPNIKTVSSEEFINYVPNVKEKIEY